MSPINYTECYDESEPEGLNFEVCQRLDVLKKTCQYLEEKSANIYYFIRDRRQPPWGRWERQSKRLRTSETVLSLSHTIASSAPATPSAKRKEAPSDEIIRLSKILAITLISTNFKKHSRDWRRPQERSKKKKKKRPVSYGIANVAIMLISDLDTSVWP